MVPMAPGIGGLAPSVGGLALGIGRLVLCIGRLAPGIGRLTLGYSWPGREAMREAASGSTKLPESNLSRAVLLLQKLLSVPHSLRLLGCSCHHTGGGKVHIVLC